MDVALQQKIGDVFSAWPSGLVNWLEVIRRFRNICAHQGRIWNRKINTRLKYNFSNNAALSDLWSCVGSSQPCGYTTVFAALSLCAWLLKCVRPQSQWTSRVKELLADYPEVPLAAMGFPADWQKLALWKDSDEEKEEDEAADSDKTDPSEPDPSEPDSANGDSSAVPAPAK